ncbi:MAG: ABC transporter ATP-binding protein [Armatimonadota bacterium]
MTPTTQPLLQVRKLKKYFPITGGMFRRAAGEVRAVDDVSFSVLPGECLGLVGESGSGKTTVGRTILRAMPPTAGEVLFQLDDKTIDLATVPAKELRSLRRHFQMVFQDPYSSLNPRMTVLDIVGEPLLIHGMRSRRAREERIRELLTQVGLQEQHLNRYPHAFSGGQRQRIGIARALALNPRLIVADEPVSALDVSVQAQVLNLLRELQERLGLTYLFIAHDLSVVRHVCDRVAVMYAGNIVEMAAVDDLYGVPRHPYTEALLSAIPIPDPRRRSQRILLSGEVADPSHLPTGCAFHPRCRYAETRCREQAPEMRDIAPGREVRCHRAEDLELAGIT